MVRGDRSCGSRLSTSGRAGDRAARPVRLRQVDADALHRRRAAGRRRHGQRARASRPGARRCASGSATSPRRQRLRRPDGHREPALLRPGPRRRRRRGRPGRRRRRPRHARRRRSSAGSAAGSGRGPAWRSRCSASPTCWCSTSRPSASTRCCAATCGTLFHRLADGGAAVLVSSHVMDEAERCDRLLLMRDGAIIADDTPDAICATPAPTTSRRRSSRLRRTDRTAAPGCRTRMTPGSPSPSPAGC